MTALVARRPHPGILSARKPADLRTELDQAIRPVPDEDRTRVAALVGRSCGDQSAQVLSMLGLEVTS